LKKGILGLTDIDFITSRFLVGADLQGYGRFRECIEWLEQFMKDLPKDSHYTTFLQAIIHLSLSHNGLNEYRTSFELCTKALDQFEGIAPVDDPTIIEVYKVMGNALIGLNRPKEALIWSTKAFDGTQRIFGPQHLSTYIALEYMTYVYAALGDLKKACKWQEKCVNFMKDSLGTDHPATIRAEEALVNFTAERKSHLFSRRRIIVRRKALLDKMKQQFGEKDWRTLSCESRLVEDYFLCSSMKKAILMQEKWLEVMIQEFGQEDDRTIEGIADLSRIKMAMAIRNAVYWWVPQWYLK
jgi:tetratricopeptide (TPR) repeat protein